MMLKAVQDAEASNENTASSSLLDEIVRNGALQLSGRAAIPLIVICQCAVARQVVAP